MEEDEDDLYAENGAIEAEQHDQGEAIPNNQEDVEDDDEEEEGEEEEDDSSDSDIEILTERKPGEEPSPPQAPRHSALRVDSRPIQDTSARQSSTQRVSPPPLKSDSDPSGRPQVTVQSGRGYPEVRTSKIDVNGDPILPQVGKPISDIEVDADLVEHEKPWRRPGADQSDYFNYGFDEFTWSTYCMRQKTMGEALNEQKAESATFEMMMGGMGMPGMPQMPGAPAGPAAQGGMPAMPTMPGMDGMGMPNQEQMAAALQQAMIAQGVTDPNHVDFNLFMQQQMQGGGQMGQAAVPQGPAAQQHGGYGGGQQGWQGQGGGGYGRGKRGQRW